MNRMAVLLARPCSTCELTVMPVAQPISVASEQTVAANRRSGASRTSIE
jgi:hypothetical protein